MAAPRLFHLLHLSHRAVFRAADRMIAMRFGVTAAQHGALMYVRENEGASMGALARALGLKGAATSGLVDRMEQKGLMERRRAISDGRSFELFLKPQGRHIVETSQSLIKESNAKLLEGFTAADQALIADFLETLAKRADAFRPTESKQDIHHD